MFFSVTETRYRKLLSHIVATFFMSLLGLF